MLFRASRCGILAKDLGNRDRTMVDSSLPVSGGFRLPSASAAVSALFGYDFFISYAHDDGIDYPKALARALEAEPYRYTTHLDTRDYHLGDDLGRLTRLRVRHSRRLVVVVRPAALTTSTWVRREVDAYVASGRDPIIIDCDGAIERQENASARKGTLLEWLRTNPQVLRQEERGHTAAPGDGTLQRLAAAFEGVRVEEWRRRMVMATMAVLCLLLAGSVLLGALAEIQRRAAVAQRERVELELSRADARQAEQYLGQGRYDAAAAFLARARAGRPSELSSLVGHMLPQPPFVPTRRLRLPLSTGVVMQAWADEEGRYLAVMEATGHDAVQVYDLGGAEALPVLTLDIGAEDPVFRLISSPRPAAVTLTRRSEEWLAEGGGPEAAGPDAAQEAGEAELPDAAAGGPAITVRWLDTPDAAPVSRRVAADVGYESLVRLSDGRYHFAQGSTVSAVSIGADGIGVEAIATGLRGHVNRATATEDAPCMMLSDTSGTFALRYVDGRPPVLWDSRPLWEGVEDQNANHPQGVLDATCRYAAIWFDGGKPGVHLVRLFDAAGKLTPALVASVAGDPSDSISFRNRFFDAEGTRLFVRNNGLWTVYDTATGRLLRTIDTGQPDSPGALTADGTLLTAGYGDVVSFLGTGKDGGGDGQVTAGPAPKVFALRKRLDAATGKPSRAAFLTVASDGLVTLFEPAGRKRYEGFGVIPAGGTAPSQAALSPDGTIFVQDIEPESGGQEAGGQETGGRRLFIQKLGGQGEIRAFDCPQASNVAILATDDAAEVVSVTADATLCRARLDPADLSLGPVARTALGLDAPVDLVRAARPSGLLIVAASGRRAYELPLDGAAPAPGPMHEAPSAGPITDVAADPSGRIAILAEDALAVATGGGRVLAQFNGTCSRIVGFAAGAVVVQCRKGFFARLFAASLEDGSVRPLALPPGADVEDAAVSPDGTTLVVPLSDADEWVRQVYAQLLDTGASFVFTPLVIADARSGDDAGAPGPGRLPRIDGMHFAPDGSRLFLDLASGFLEQHLITNGPLSRFEAGQVGRLTGLSLSSTPLRSDLEYLTETGGSPD